jgi:hypothetical protein
MAMHCERLGFIGVSPATLLAYELPLCWHIAWVWPSRDMYEHYRGRAAPGVLG